MKKVQPSNQEMTILSLLWERGPMTARQVLESMPDGKARAYTSVLSVLQAMERKGFVGHTSEAGVNVYAPEVEKEQALRPMMRDLVQNLFGGRTSTAMQQLLEDTEVDDAELLEIQQLIKNYRRQKGDRR
jgi:predicted transcriptional regulator